MLWIDFDENYIFGHRENKVVPLMARRCLLGRPRLVFNYKRQVKTAYNKGKFLERLCSAIKKFEADPELIRRWKDIDAMDDERTKIMLDGERHCRPQYSGCIPWSATITRKCTGLHFLNLAIKSRTRRGKKYSRRKIKRLQKKLDLAYLPWNKMNPSELKSILTTKRDEYFPMKEHGVEHHKKQIRLQAEELVARDGTDPDQVESQLIDRTKTKADWWKIKYHCQGNRKGGLNKLNIPDLDAPLGRKDCFSKEEIESELLTENKKECLKAYDSPALQYPLCQELGLQGDGPAVEDILRGEYNPPSGTDPYMEAYLKALESPNKDELDNIPLPWISLVDNMEDLHKTAKRTSSSPLGLHYGLWKTNSMDPLLNKIDTLFRDVVFRCGKVYTRWKQAIDVEILEEPGNYKIDCQQIIVLIEGDHQLNGKRLGKLAMEKADKRFSLIIAREQYGSRKGHHPAEVLLNTRLVDDILRIKRKPRIICSNDAMSCYNRITHAIFAICLRRLGVHPNPIKSSILTLQALEHHIRMEFGDSDCSYCGSKNYPLQGLVQGYGPPPTGWVVISTPLIEMMREAGYGLKD